MQNKYSENMILKVCYACGIVIIAVIAGDYGMPEECAKKYHINGKSAPFLYENLYKKLAACLPVASGIFL